MNQVAIVTGASRGIGRGVSIGLAKIGYNLVLNYASNTEAARATLAECEQAGAPCAIAAEICQSDISQAQDRERLVAFTRERFGRLDLLVNNAGVAPEVRADILDASEESLDRLLRINVKGPYLLTQAAAKWMIEQAKTTPEGNTRPKIVTITSISAYTASVNRGDYCISKAALSMVTPLFAARLAEYGIGVFEIRPGIIATDMTSGVKGKYDTLINQGLTPIRRWGKPEDVARAVCAIATDMLPFSTGEVINVDGGFHLRTL